MRYYTSTTGEMVLQAGIAPSDTTITVDTTAGLPGSYPYTLFLDYGTPSEEIVDVTAAAGTTLTVTRGRDGTVAQSHAFGAKIRHGISARDLRESREHEAATAAHGVTEVVGADEAQTLDNKTFAPSDDHTAAVFRARSGNTEPLVEIQDSAGTGVGTIDEDGIASLSGGNTMLSLLFGTAVTFYKYIASFRIAADVHGIVGNVVSGATGRFLRLMSGATELFYVAATGAIKAMGATFDGNVSVTGDVTATGSLSSPTITALQSADTALDGRLDTLEGQTLSTRISAVETNLGSQTTFAATSASKDTKRVHWGVATVSPGGTGYATITHGAGFTPTVVIASTEEAVFVGVHDFAFTSTQFTVRLLERDGSAYAGSADVYYFCGE